MNVLGMGPLELVVILALALIVFGPQKLPEIGAQIGKAMRDFRRATSDLSDEFSRGLQLEVNERRQDGRAGAPATPAAPAALPTAPRSDGALPASQPPTAPATSAPARGADLEPPY